MQINVTYDQSLSSLPAAFVSAINYVVNYFDTLFTNNVTINLDVGYGEIAGQPLVSGALGESEAANYVSESYSSARNALLAEGAPGASTLPATSPLSGTLYMSQAEAQALGLTTAVSTNYVGFSSIYPFGFAANVTPASNEYYFIGIVEHEISEDMGRVSLLNYPGDYAPIDLYRYSSPGVRDTTTGGAGSTAYFSINNGTTNLGTWNNQVSNGDLADWYPSGPAPGGDDAFNDYSSPGVINILSADDITLLEALGWTTQTNGIVVSATTSEALQGGSSVLLLSGATITDSAKTNLASATITITNGSGTAVAGDKLSIGGQQSGTLDGGLVTVSWNGTTDTLALTGNVSIAEYETLLSEVSYQDTGTDTSSGSHPVRTVTWTVNDGTNSYNTTSHVTIDRAPVANNATATDSTGSTVTATAATGVLSGDTDPDGDTLTVIGVSDSAHGAGTVGGALAGVYGSLTLNADGSYSYTASNTAAINAAATGSTPVDVFTYTVSDGNGGTSSATLDIAVERPPVVTTSNITANANQTLAGSSLFTVSDPDGLPITEYEFWQVAGTAGYFELNGVQQPTQTAIVVTPSQLSELSFVAGAASTDNLQIRAYDGQNWSAVFNAAWAPFDVNVAAPPAPIVTTSNINATPGEVIPGSSLFTVSDPDGLPITEYEFWQVAGTAGYFELNGVQQPTQTAIVVTPSQLSELSFVAGAASTDNLQIRAYDGQNWSAAFSTAWAPFDVNVAAPPAPIVTTSNINATPGEVIPGSSLFTVSDPDGLTITEYEFWQVAGTAGYFELNGVQQPTQTAIVVTPSQLSELSFVAGAASTDNLQIRAYDGQNWSAVFNAAWAPFDVNVAAPPAPIVTTSNINATPGEVIPGSSLFTVTDPDGLTITEYEFWQVAGTAGYFELNGVQQPTQTAIVVTPSQLSELSFVAGAASTDNLQIRAYDGQNWSAVFNAAWAPFDVNVAAPPAPIVTTSNINATPGEVIPGSSLFTVTDPDGLTITEYEFWQVAGTAGYFELNGVQQPTQTAIVVTPSQLSELSFVAGAASTDNLQIRAYDGQNWSAAFSTAWAPFDVIVSGGSGSSGASLTVGVGATLDLAGSDSDSVTFDGATGTLALDQSSTFSGETFNFTGNGNPATSDQIDLKDIPFGAGTTESYSGNIEGGTLPVSESRVSSQNDGWDHEGTFALDASNTINGQHLLEWHSNLDASAVSAATFIRPQAFWNDDHAQWLFQAADPSHNAMASFGNHDGIAPANSQPDTAELASFFTHHPAG